MKKVLGFLLAVSLGVALDRLGSGGPAAAAAGGGQGGVAVECTTKNGDVNADTKVDLSDATTILGHLFLGNPTKLVGLCATQGSSGQPRLVKQLSLPLHQPGEGHLLNCVHNGTCAAGLVGLDGPASQRTLGSSLAGLPGTFRSAPACRISELQGAGSSAGGVDANWA